MKGLWQLTTRTIDPGIGVTIFDGIVALVVVLFTCIAIARRSRQWPEAWLLYVSMLFLSSWSVIHWVDVMVHQFRARVTYSYILIGCFYNVIRAFSDVFVLWGTWRVLIRYEHLRPTMKDTPTFCCATLIVGLLSFLALYHICLLFALAFAWLSFADLDAINNIAEARNCFEIAFTAFYFLSTIWTALWVFDIKANRSPKTEYSKEVGYSFGASTALLFRSFCEVVIVGQQDRWPDDVQAIAGARDITYGLFNMFFVGFIAFAIPNNISNEDPLISREYAAVEQVTTWIIQRLDQVTDRGKKTAPTMSTLLESLDTTLGPDNRKNWVLKIKRNEIKRLKALYADWEPIYKWNGANSD